LGVLILTEALQKIYPLAFIDWTTKMLHRSRVGQQRKDV